MAMLTKDGYHWRIKCAWCGRYFITRRAHAATCSGSCRQKLKRAGGVKNFKVLIESLGYMLAGNFVKGKLGECIAPREEV
jgi:hypothetical protein